MFECREDVLRWVRSVAHENGFVAVILRSDTNTGSRGSNMFVLIGCERNGEYSIGVGKKNLSEETLGLGNVGVPSSFFASQWLEEKTRW